MDRRQLQIVVGLSSFLAVLMVVLIVALIVDSGDGDDSFAGTTTTTTTEAITTAAVTTTTTAATTTTAVAATTTIAPTTTAPPTTAGTSTAPPPPDFALAFDGNDDFVSVADSGDFDFTDAMTLEAWVRPTSLPAGASHSAIIQGANTEPPFGGHRWVISLDGSDHSDWGATGCTPSCSTVGTGPGGLVVGEWQHIAVTYDGVTLMIYKNGEFLDGTPLSGEFGDVGFVLFGVWVDSFHGLVDEVRIWNVTRLPAQVQASHGQVLQGDEPGLVGYWRFNEGSGQVTADASSRGNDARLGALGGEDPSDPVWSPSDVPVG